MPPPLQTSFSRIAEATDASTRILRLQADLFLLKQEVKAVQQLQRAFLVGTALLLMNLALTLTFLWIGMGLRDSGWSPFGLALLCFITFGSLTAWVAWRAFRFKKEGSA